MSHEFDSGLFIGDAAWHGLGKNIAVPPASTAEAMRLAGMDWSVLERPIYEDVYDSDLPIERDGYRLVVINANYKKLVRSDNNYELQVCKKSWTPVQNSEAFSWFDPLIADGDVELSSAVSLKKGERIAITAKIKDAGLDVVTGDKVEGFLLLFNSHKGDLGVGVRFTNIRTVCHNTLQMNLNQMGKLSSGGAFTWEGKNATIKHTRNVGVGMETVRNALDIHKRSFRQTIESYRAMAQVQLKTGDFEKFVAATMKTHAKFDSPLELRCYDRLVENFETGLGAEIPGVRGTAWAAYNAITDWTTHQRGKKGNTMQTLQDRLESNWFGSGAAIDRSAYAAAVALTLA